MARSGASSTARHPGSTVTAWQVDGGIALEVSAAALQPHGSWRTTDRTVLFDWRWRTAGPHTISFEAGVENAKEGRNFPHIRSYLVLS